MIEGATKYLGKSWIGTNTTDKGQCVGLYNQVVLDVSGVLYPIIGVIGAKDLLTAQNTRPDLFQQIKNNPNDPNQLPQPGDWMIWGASWGGGYGHVACVESVNSNGFTSIEQNYTPNTVTRQNHNWNGIIGWIHYTKNTPSPGGGDTMSDDTARQIGFNYLGRNGYDGRPNALVAPQTDLQGLPLTNQKLSEIFLSQESRNWRDSALPQVYADRDNYKKQVASLTTEVQALNNQIAHLTVDNNNLTTQLDAANKKIKELEAASGGNNITINFNFIGLLLWNLIKTLGMKKQ